MIVLSAVWVSCASPTPNDKHSLGPLSVPGVVDTTTTAGADSISLLPPAGNGQGERSVLLPDETDAGPTGPVKFLTDSAADPLATVVILPGAGGTIRQGLSLCEEVLAAQLRCTIVVSPGFDLATLFANETLAPPVSAPKAVTQALEHLRASGSSRGWDTVAIISIGAAGPVAMRITPWGSSPGIVKVGDGFNPTDPVDGLQRPLLSISFDDLNVLPLDLSIASLQSGRNGVILGMDGSYLDIGGSCELLGLEEVREQLSRELLNSLGPSCTMSAESRRERTNAVGAMVASLVLDAKSRSWRTVICGVDGPGFGTRVLSKTC